MKNSATPSLHRNEQPPAVEGRGYMADSPPAMAPTGSPASAFPSAADAGSLSGVGTR